MDKKKASLIFALACVLVFSSIQTASALSFEKGRNYDKEILGYSKNNNEYVRWTSHPERIIDSYQWTGKPIYKDYRLFDSAGNVYLETANSGSVAFDKTLCSYNLYDSGYIDLQNPPKIKNISWSVKGKAAASSSWNPVNGVNNAGCSVTIQNDDENVRIVGEKKSSVGTFQIVLDYTPGRGIKETMRAYNNNSAWNNHNIGFTETFEVPKIIKLGNQTYDLSNYNGTSLNRNWIDANKAKVLKLSEKIFYDFGIGFDNLDTVGISWDGSKAKLSLNYLYPTGIVPYQQWIDVDPVFTSSNPTVDGHILTTATAATQCSTTALSRATTGTTMLGSNIQSSGSNAECYYAFSEWDISSLDTDITPTNVTYSFEITAGANQRNCAIVGLTTRPSTATDQQLLDNVRPMGAAVIVSASSTCTTVGESKTILTGSNGTTYITNRLAGGWAAFGMRFQDMTRDASAHSVSWATEEDAGAVPPPTLTITYTDPTPDPDAVTDLSASTITTVTTLLDWTEPSLNGGTLLGYQINYSSGCTGAPNTIIENDTGTSDTSYTATVTQPSNCFRVGPWTTFGSNMTGNIATISGVSFIIGDINVTQSNPDRIGIRFERTDLNSTASYLNVTYADTYDLACNFFYEFARTNNTYTDLTNSTAGDGFVESSFLLTNSDRDVIQVKCWDQLTNDTGRYIITQSTFPILEQISNFREGQYGTAGMFGAIDFITLIVIIISMIGFNRIDETVGVIFNTFFIFGLAFFEIIHWETAMIGFFAVGVVFAIAKNRGD